MSIVKTFRNWLYGLVAEEANRRLRDLQVAAEVSKQVSTELDPDRLLPRLAGLTKESFGLYHAHVYLLDARGERLEMAAGAGEAGRIMKEQGHGILLSAERSLVARAARTREPVIVLDVKDEPDHLPNPLLPLTRSEMAVPMVLGERLVGVLDVQSEQPGRFSADDIPVMTTLAGQVAVAVENARAFAAIRQAQEETQTALEQVARHNRYSGGVAKFATTLLDRGVEGLGEGLAPLGEAARASRAYYFESFTDAEGKLAARQVHEWVAEGIAPAENPHVVYDEALPHWKDDLLAGRPVVARRTSAPQPEVAIMQEQDILSLLLIPVAGEDGTRGFLGFDDCRAEREWDAAEIDLLQTAGVAISYALAGAQLLKRTQEALLQVEMLYHTGRALASARSPQELLEAFHEPLKPSQPSRLGLLHIDAGQDGRPEWAELVAAIQTDEGKPFVESRERIHLPGHALASLFAIDPHQVQVVADVDEPHPVVGEATRRALKAAGVRAVAFVPLAPLGQRWTGGIAIGWPEPHALDEAEQLLLGLLVPQAATLLDNMRLLQKTERSESLLRTVVDSSPDWIWAKDRNFRFLLANRAFAGQGFGTTPEDVLGKDDYDFAPAELVDGNPEKGIVGFRVDDRKALAGETVHNPYDVVVFSDGSEHILDTKKMPLYDSEGNIVGTLGVGRDITEQRRAREREQLAYELGQQLAQLLDPDELLQATVQRLSQTFGYYHAHIYLLDEAGEKLVVAEGLGEAGRMMKQAGHSIALDAERSLVARAARSREPVVVNDVAENPDHLPNPMLPLTRAEAAVPLLAGERLMGVLDAQHVRQGHFTPEEARTLAIVGNQLAIALSNAELYREQLETTERLREVDKLKSEFLANVSHELRTPLNSIIGYSELLIDELSAEMDEMSVEDLKAIHSSGHHLLAIINDILDLAKIEAGRLELQKAAVDLGSLIPQVADTARVLLKDRPQVKLLLDAPGDLPQIEADPVRLRQILWNLLSNAIKFTDKGHVRLACQPDDGWVVFRVEDTGVGIPPDQQEVIFDQFRQVDGSPTRRQGGTGLGLTITRELVLIHGGEIKLESRVGEGTTFTVRLPLEAAEKVRTGTGPLAATEKRPNGRETVSAD